MANIKLDTAQYKTGTVNLKATDKKGTQIDKTS